MIAMKLNTQKKQTSPVGPNGAAVITPYCKESLTILKRCHQSCLNQEGDCQLRHIMVADGYPRESLRNWDLNHIILPHSHADNGNTPRCIGAITAINQGFWPILFLDADNWFKPWHLNTMVDLKRSHPNADVLAMGRECALPDGTPIVGIPEEDLKHRHIDTSCYVFYPSAFRVLSLWGMMPKFLSPICDRFIREAITDYGLILAGTHFPSVVFTAHYSWAYQALGRPIPEDVHDVNWSLIKDQFNPSEIYDRTGLNFNFPFSLKTDKKHNPAQNGSSIRGPYLSGSTNFRRD